MQTQTLQQRNTISLQGSSLIVTEFFQYAIQCILYQRGVYPSESFDKKKHYGLGLWVTNDDGLGTYLKTITEQMMVWTDQGSLRQMVLVITEAETQEVLERWTFDIDTNKEVLAGGPLPDKPDSEIKGEIMAIMRQICASVSFLPLLETRCTIDILVYTDSKEAVPEEWEDSDAKNIADAEVVTLRGFSTKVHSVKTLVAFKQSEDVL
ncbi:MAG: hypothetical protein WDW38_009503 [Sanguina aurantia]